MITSPAYAGAAFGTAGDGDLTDAAVRGAAAAALGIPQEWAWMRQVHGASVAWVEAPGHAGEADALVTARPGLPLAVRTADCIPLVMHAASAVAVVHAGWRGLAAGVVEQTIDAMTKAGDTPLRAAIGPAIGPCCYEVGPEVVAALRGRKATTSWGTTSVDLWSEAELRLADIPVWRADLCTRCETHFHSYRADGTDLRQTTVGWQ